MWYVGHKGIKLVAFKSKELPTEKSHSQFKAVVGPFKTKRAAKWHEKYGFLNPHCTCVNVIERLAKNV
jgi:hypothetical protein